MLISANLGFLFADRPLPEAIRAAARAGFDAVECHWPYAVPAGEVRAALAETGLEMLGLNTSRGQPGENGLMAVPGREAEAQEALAQAIDYARAIGTRKIHAMAGFAEGALAHATFLSNLAAGAEMAGAQGITLMIEPLNGYDAPGYFLKNTTQAAAIIEELAHPALRLMFDLYHVQASEGDVIRRMRRLLPLIAHVQFAAVPDRGEPGAGELDIAGVLRALAAEGWTAPVGAEYRPRGGVTATEAGLGWMPGFRAI